MNIEETAASPVAEDTTAPVADTTSDQGAEPQGDDLEQYLDDGTGDDNPDTVEIELDGKTYKVPLELKDGFLRQKDYTQKTMTLAEERKAIEAAKAEVEQLKSTSEAKLEATIAHRQASARVEQLLATPIDGLPQDQINALQLELIHAQNAEAKAAKAIEEAGSKAQEIDSQQFAKAIEAARKEAAKHIPNFSDERLAAYGSFVEKLGGDREVVNQVTDPVVLRVLDFAEIGMRVLDRQRQAKAASTVTATQPAAEVGGKRSNSAPRDLVKDADKMSGDEWLKARNAQLSRR